MNIQIIFFCIKTYLHNKNYFKPARSLYPIKFTCLKIFMFKLYLEKKTLDDLRRVII